jgi:DNA-binding response OmpR family regulator
MNIPRASRLGEARPESGLTEKFQRQKNSLQPEILLIKDGSGVFAKIGAMLQQIGFQVTLAPDTDSALEKLQHSTFAAVIAGASQEQPEGLEVLAASKEKNAEMKTMVVTSLVKPELPVKAYEMEIDDYIHWPLSSAELGGRLKNLLEPGWERDTREWDHPDPGAQNQSALTTMGSLVEGFAGSLAMISQSLEDMRQEHLEDMQEGLSAELCSVASQVRNLSEKMRQCWQLGTAGEPVSMAKEQRFH